MGESCNTPIFNISLLVLLLNDIGFNIINNIDLFGITLKIWIGYGFHIYPRSGHGYHTIRTHGYPFTSLYISSQEPKPIMYLKSKLLLVNKTGGGGVVYFNNNICALATSILILIFMVETWDWDCLVCSLATSVFMLVCF